MWYMWMRSITKCYKEDPADKGDGGGSGGDAGDKDDGTPDPAEVLKNMSDDAVAELVKGRSFGIKVDGVEKNVTLSEALKDAEKVGGADSKLREAAELRKSGAEGIALKETLAAFKAGTAGEEEITKFCDLMGIDKKEMAELTKADPGKAAGDPPEFAELSPDDRETMDQARQIQVERADQKIRDDVKNAVDKDEYFGKIVVETPKDKRENRGDAIKAMVHRAVRTKILASPYTKEIFGTSMISAAVQEVRAELEKYGIPSGKDKQAEMASVLSALGSTIEIPAEIQSDKPIERVPVDDPTYEDNFVMRMAQKQLMGQKK